MSFSSSVSISDDVLEDNRKILAFSRECGLCDRCCLRNLGEIYSSAVFNETDQEVKQKLDQLTGKTEIEEPNGTEKDLQAVDEPLVKKRTPNHCFCCLSILQRGCQPDFLEQIVDQIVATNYTFTRFQINLFLPIAITLRENFINAKLLDKFPHLSKRFASNYTVKDVYRFAIIRRVSKRIDARFDAEARFEIIVETSYEHSSYECAQLRRNKDVQQLNHSSINRAITALGLKGVLKLKLNIPTHCFRLDRVKVINLPLYLVGRYNKFARGISQTPWLKKEGMQKQSVEAVITGEISKHIPCEVTRFSASGREDVDVRMLGQGRPFVVELINPKFLEVTEDILIAIEQGVKESSGGDIQIRDFQLGEKEEVASNLKEGESDKRKQYTALCICSRPLTVEDFKKISEISDLKINQNTPIRVLHRRSLATRHRLVYTASAYPDSEDKQTFRLDLETEAGTYVKEFVHGDFGRTQPSLASVLGDCETDILELDVKDICMEWPPKITRAHQTEEINSRQSVD